MLNIKNSKKKAEASITFNELIALILVAVVIFIVLFAIFSPGIWDWVRSLPDYKYNDTDREIKYIPTDAELKGVCPGASKVGFVGKFSGDTGFREQYVNLFIGNELKQTKLYWRGSETKGEIWLYEKDKYTGWDWLKSDLLVASVNEKGIIKVEPGLLDLDSEIYQKTRFEKQVPELYLLPYLENAYLAFNNQICRIAEPAKLKPAWPESIGKKLNLISPKIRIEKKKYKIDLSPYLTPQAINFLYLEDKGSYIEIKGDISWGVDYRELGRIYPDGSVWLSLKDLSLKRKNSELVIVKFSEEFFGRENLNYEPFYETNLKLENYDSIKQIIS